MALVVDQLQIWTIGFKWAGLEPTKPWIRIPTLVLDNFSTLLQAILSDHLGCLTLAPERYTGDDPESAKYYIRYWLDHVNAAIQGQRFDRKLLKHAVIDRGDFQDWCERRSIPLPEFWFPPDWTEYRWPCEDFEPIPIESAETPAVPTPEPTLAQDATNTASLEPHVRTEQNEPVKPKLRPVQLATIVSQEIAKVIWKEEPDKTIAAMVKDDRIQKYGSGQYYSEDVVRRWVKAVELKKGNKPATVNRYLATIRSLFRMARDEWQWIDTFPKIKLLSGEVERDRWLTHDEADRLIRHCPPHLAALVRYALATGCRASEITGLEWNRVDLDRKTAWLNQTKNGTPRGVPLNEDAIEVLREQIGKSLTHCFTFRGEPIGWQVSNTAWHTALKAAGIKDFKFHDLRHTWASWHRQAGTSCDELKDLGGWKSREMVDRYAKYGTEHLAVAAMRIQRVRVENVSNVVTFLSRSTMEKGLATG